MSRAIDRAPARAAVPKPGKAALAVRRFSSLEETKKKATLARMHRITNAIWCMRASVAFFFRSEEHTSELQSQSNLVCRLLLEKKKIISDHLLRGLEMKRKTRQTSYSNTRVFITVIVDPRETLWYTHHATQQPFNELHSQSDLL